MRAPDKLRIRNEEKPETEFDLLSIAKWLLPSVSVLFLVVGYVIESSRHSLLGVSSELLGTPNYISVAAQFLRDLFVLLLDSALNLRAVEDEPRKYAPLLFLPGLALFLYALDRFYGRLGGGTLSSLALWVSGRWFGIILVAGGLFTVITILAYDQPVVRLENVLVTGNDSLESSLSIDKGAARSETDRAISRQARKIWQEMVCMRVSPESARYLHKRIQVKCTRSPEAHRKKVEAFFLFNTLLKMELAIVWLVLITHASGRAVPIVGGLALLYFILAVPYVYGKLIRPTEVEYGDIQFKSAVVEMRNVGESFSTVKPGAGQKKGPVKPKPAGQDPNAQPPVAAAVDGKVLSALILSRGDKHVRLYVRKEVRCRPGGSVPVSYPWRFWEAAASEVIAVKWLERRDIITEFSLSGPDCDAVRAPR